MSSMCNCNLINPKYISSFYKHPSELVPTPSYIKKLKKKECTLQLCLPLHRNYLYNYHDRYNYKGYYFRNKFLICHKQKMQETFHIIKMLNKHVKDNKDNKDKQYTIKQCNSLICKIQYDINGDIGIRIIFEKEMNEYDSDDDDDIGSNNEYDNKYDNAYDSDDEYDSNDEYETSFKKLNLN